MNFKMLQSNEFEYCDKNGELELVSLDHISGFCRREECMDDLVSTYMIDISSAVLVDKFVNDTNCPDIIDSEITIINMSDWSLYNKIKISKINGKLVWSTE